MYRTAVLNCTILLYYTIVLHSTIVLLNTLYRCIIIVMPTLAVEHRRAQALHRGRCRPPHPLRCRFAVASPSLLPWGATAARRRPRRLGHQRSSQCQFPRRPCSSSRTWRWGSRRTCRRRSWRTWPLPAWSQQQPRPRVGLSRRRHRRPPPPRAPGVAGAAAAARARREARRSAKTRKSRRRQRT